MRADRPEIAVLPPDGSVPMPWCSRFGYEILHVAHEPFDAADARMAALMRRVWALPAAPAIEMAWIATGGVVGVRLTFCLRGDSGEIALADACTARDAVAHALSDICPSWMLRPLTSVESSARVRGPVSEVRRHMLRADTPGDCLRVPLGAGGDRSSQRSVVERLAEAPDGTVVIVAAEKVAPYGPYAERLRSRVAEIEDCAEALNMTQGIPTFADAAPDAPLHELRLAAALAAARCALPGSLHLLRASIAGPGSGDPALGAAVCTMLSGSIDSVALVGAAEAGELRTALRNVNRCGFEPWGLYGASAELNALRESIHTAAFDEAGHWLRLPLCGDRPQLGMRRLSPAPMPVPPDVPVTGALLGASAYRPDRPVALDEATRDRHVYAIGKTGSGKSTLLLNAALDDVDAGCGVMILEPHGDLTRSFIDALPARHRDRLEILDPGDPGTLTVNPLALRPHEDLDARVDALGNMWVRIWDNGQNEIVGPLWLKCHDAACRLLAGGPVPGSLSQITRLFHDDEFREGRLMFCDDEEVLRFWTEEFPKNRDRGEITSYFTSKFRPFTANRLMRRVVDTPKPTLDMTRIMDEGRILVVRIPKGELGPLNSSILGTLVSMEMEAAAFARASRPAAERRPFSVFMDEVQCFATAGTDVLVAEGRKYGLRLMMANQNISQVERALRLTLLGNVGTLVAFRLGLADAESLEAEFMPAFDARSLTRLQTGRAVVRMATAAGPDAVFDVITRTPPVPVVRTEPAAPDRAASLDPRPSPAIVRPDIRRRAAQAEAARRASDQDTA